MASERSWSSYPEQYRAAEMATLARWILLGQSGSVVGLPGAGKSNLLIYLCGRAEVLASYEPQLAGRTKLILIDLNNLPDRSLATFYRVILRGFAEAAGQFAPDLQQVIETQYREARAERDPFLCQSALRQLLKSFQGAELRIVLVFDRFDDFCQQAPPAVTATLRGLRDSFKDTLSFIAGMTQEAIYLANPESLGELYDLLDINVCWVGALGEEDSHHVIDTVTGPSGVAPSEQERARFIGMSGGHPGLLKSICLHWLNEPARTRQGWVDALLADPAIRVRLNESWSALSQEEQLRLSQLRQASGGGAEATFPGNRPGVQQDGLMDRLASKGLVHWVEQTAGRSWRFSGELMAAFVSEVGGRSRGTLWFDPVADTIYLGDTPLDSLSPLEHSLLRFLLSYPRVRHSYTALIEAAWPEAIHKEGVTTEALYQVVRGIRRRLEPDPSQPRYIVNWRGRPEGGYLCFPEGRPA